ncbi:MAG: GGDEF domain-containing protein [Sulfurimonas sp.]
MHYLQNGGDPAKISLDKVEDKIYKLHGIIKKLINYEIEVAQFERKKFLNKYEDMALNIGLVLIFVIVAVFVISTYVFKSIQQDHTKLHAIAKKLKSANKKLENASYTDSLTNLYNRRYFNHIYERELKRAKRDKTYITFMMLDIDYFKQYNDTYGHVEGDFALKTVAKVLKDTLKRPSDYVFRLGGEEFGILLSQTNESDSANLARKLLSAVKLRELKHEKSKVSDYVTVSVGVVCCIADDALADEVLISRADEMLYEAKEGGRDRYQITTNVTLAKTVNA